MFVLNHFSLKYSNTEIKSFFENEMKIHEITNIHPWVLFYPRWSKIYLKFLIYTLNPLKYIEI